jgi:hypothetical protein
LAAETVLSRDEEVRMTDLLFILLVIVFFGLAAVFVAACDRIIGHDEEDAPVQVETVREKVPA